MSQSLPQTLQTIREDEVFFTSAMGFPPGHDAPQRLSGPRLGVNSEFIRERLIS